MPLGLGSLLVLSIDLFTEQGPATSLAYESAEANVMARPPRDTRTERLVSFPLLFYAYVIMGLAESLVCMGAYMWVFTHRGVAISDIFMLDPADATWSVLADRNDNSAFSNGVEFSPEAQAQVVREVRAFTRECGEFTVRGSVR